MEYIKKKYIKISQPLGDFYIIKMTPKELISISKKDISRYSDSINGIQRNISDSRRKEINDYIYNNPDATFPGSFIVGVSNETLVNEQNNEINIPLRIDEAVIIDGQHRLSGFKENEEDFEIIVSIFIGVERFDQAMIFATINGKAQKVDKSLVYDLFELTDERSYEKLAHDIVKLLNETNTSPWYRKIKMLGRGEGDLSQSAMVQQYIKIFKSGVLKGFYDKGNADTDAQIYKILENYFKAIREIFPEEWENSKKKFILTKTTGFIAFMKFFSDLYSLAKKNNSKLSVDFFQENIKLTKDKLSPLDSDNYESGARGQNKLYQDLKTALEIK